MLPISPVRNFLSEMDKRWDGSGDEKICLRIIGSTALMLQVDYERGTKDSDVLRATSLTPVIQDRLLKLAGPNSALHKKHRMYLDLVAPSIPFLGIGQQFR